jgi:hypothetical protein
VFRFYSTTSSWITSSRPVQAGRPFCASSASFFCSCVDEAFLEKKIHCTPDANRLCCNPAPDECHVISFNNQRTGSFGSQFRLHVTVGWLVWQQSQEPLLLKTTQDDQNQGWAPDYLPKSVASKSYERRHQEQHRHEVAIGKNVITKSMSRRA